MNRTTKKTVFIKVDKRNGLLFGDLNSRITKEETQPKGEKGTEATIKSKVKGERKKIPLTLLREAKKVSFSFSLLTKGKQSCSFL